MPDLPVSGELERRRHRHAVQARQRLAVALRERRLRIPGVHLRRRARGKDVNDVFCLGGKMRRLVRRRVAAASVSSESRLARPSDPPQAAAREEFTAGEPGASSCRNQLLQRQSLIGAGL